jgi:hypothetical protein
MRAYYKVMIWLLSHEIKIARSTGRNPDNIAQLSIEIQEHAGKLKQLEIQ